MLLGPTPSTQRALHPASAGASRFFPVVGADANGARNSFRLGHGQSGSQRTEVRAPKKLRCAPAGAGGHPRRHRTSPRPASSDPLHPAGVAGCALLEPPPRSGVSGERRRSLFQSGPGARQIAAMPRTRFTVTMRAATWPSLLATNREGRHKRAVRVGEQSTDEHQHETNRPSRFRDHRRSTRPPTSPV